VAINSEILRKIELDYSDRLGEEVVFDYIRVLGTKHQFIHIVFIFTVFMISLRSVLRC